MPFFCSKRTWISILDIWSLSIKLYSYLNPTESLFSAMFCQLNEVGGLISWRLWSDRVRRQMVRRPWLAREGAFADWDGRRGDSRRGSGRFNSFCALLGRLRVFWPLASVASIGKLIGAAGRLKASDASLLRLASTSFYFKWSFFEKSLHLEFPKIFWNTIFCNFVFGIYQD